MEKHRSINTMANPRNREGIGWSSSDGRMIHEQKMGATGYAVTPGDPDGVRRGTSTLRTENAASTIFGSCMEFMSSEGKS